MIHILDFNDNIIDFIDREDGALLSANLKRDVEEKTETFDFTVLSDRADNMRERNRVITQDHNGIYREFIIVHVEDDYDGTTDVQCNASYLEDLTTSKPLPPQTFEKMTTSQALTKALADTGWEVSDETEYGGVRSKSWTSYNNPYEVVNMLETAYEMVSDYYIELGSHTVEHRYVSLKKPNSLFNGKEITKGKDLTGLTRTVDTSEVRTALIALGPEDDEGNRETVIVKDDEAHAQFGLPGRYLWDVYEPESEDSSMTKERLTTLATTELNKRKQLSVSYEISALDIHRYYDDVRVSLRDIVRVKDRDFNPPLYVEAEVISCEYDMILDDTVFKFGNVVEYEETALREEFNRRLDEIRKKLNDNISNVNTIVNDAIEGELEYYERKIIKSDTPPENPVNDMLWYDTSNPDVAVLKRYYNGEWRNETAKNVEQLGGMTREQVLYNSLTNTFQNLNIQHSKLLEEVYQLLNSEYLVDNDIRNAVNNAVNNTTNIYDQIKSNLDTMTGDTATIGKLVDTQALFLKYRERLQDLYKAMRNAQVAVEDRLKLLQSQYTDEKFNDAMNEVAKTLPNGRWDSDKQQLFADIPNESDIENLRTSLQRYTDGQINDLNGVLGEQINSRINNTKNEISANISSLERKIDGIEVGGRNLFIQDASYYNDEALYGYRKIADTKTKKVITIKEKNSDVDITGIYFGFSVNGKDNVGGYRWEISNGELLRELDNDSSLENYYYISYFPNKAETLEKLSERFDIKIENGTVPTTYTLAPEDIEKAIKQAQTDAEMSAKAYAEAQDELKQIEAKAYADGIVDEEEKRAIADAIAKRDEAKQYAEQKAQDAQNAANQNTQEVIKPITTRVTSTESDVKVLKGQIGLMAKSDDVTQQLKNVDGRLTPLETTVKSNKATLDLLPDQINSKVSKQDYTTDQNNLVTRLNNADSERKQLSNSISDKVSLTEYNSGINSVKSYTDNKVNNINVGARNLFVQDFSLYSTGNLYAYRKISDTNTPKVITITDNDTTVDMTGIFFGFTGNGANADNGVRWEMFKGNLLRNLDKDSSLTSYNYFSFFPTDKTTLEKITKRFKIKIEKGTVATDWTPAPEDVNSSIANSSADTLSKANNYTDNKNNEVQKTLTKMNTDISQNGRDIQLRATKEEFNATNKTLSKTVADFTTNVATGMTFTYNENGTIQAMNIGNDGIKLRGDKVDITVNKEFNVVANKVDNKVGKDEVINRLNLSPEGLDIDVNKVGIRGGDGTNYIYLSQDKIEMAGTFQRTFRGNTQKDNVFMRAQGGYLRFRNNNQNRSLYYSDFGISTYIDGDSSEASGTLQFFDYTYSPTNSVRGVTLNSAGGAVALNSERNRVVLDANTTVNIESETSSVYIRPMKENRVGTNEFRFWTKLNDSAADTDGVLSYGSITTLVEKAPASYSFGSGIRFDKSPKSNYIYATDKDGNIGTGDFYARNLLGNWWAKNNNLYALVDPKEGKLRITDYNGYNNGSPKYKDLQCDDIQANSVRVNTGQNFYIGVSTNELWVTNNLRYNGGNTGFKPVRASDFIKASSAEFKHDIKKWDYDALNVISNELQLYSYKYNDDEKETIHHGPVIGDGYDIPVEFVFNSGVNTNEMLSWALRAIQQLNEKINTLEEQLNE
ncbi:phage tail spike protein [Staphylococcus haemolyticus]|uniref:phage tail spike protein n=1 Tax=Staphylococcus haemolyticus TaxID=1283 RepID=UPI0029053683|nr:phage tail spike protein [Staphylococcus haemolyticus]MDU0485416.1 phage tail spike protein [Staphylococcus haemolyticus]